MNWKEAATEKLRRYSAMEAASHNLPLEIARLESDACSIRSARSDATPVFGGGSRREEALLNNIVEREELLRALERTQLWLKITQRGLGALSPQEKLILHRMYVCPEKGAVDRLCTELGLEQSSIYRKRDQALHRFTTACYGITE